MSDPTATTAAAAIATLPLADLAENSAVRVDVDGYRLAVVRFEGDDIHVIADRCSHADFSLGEGELDTDDRTLECWKHGSTFSVETGEPTCLPATKWVEVYDVSVADGVVTISAAVSSTENQGGQ